MSKVSMRFFDDNLIRAFWDEASTKWRFSVLDITSVLQKQGDFTENLNNGKSVLESAITQLNILDTDGKQILTDTLEYEDVIMFGNQFPSGTAQRFIDWFASGPESIDGKSKLKAYALFDTGLLNKIQVGTAKGLQRIHGYLFEDLYAFAGQIRTHNISKGGFQFAMAQFLPNTLSQIDKMPKRTFTEIVDAYVEMNIAHPFMEGNGRSMRIWLDLILKKQLQKCVDWSKISKTNYMHAMIMSSVDSSMLHAQLHAALSDDMHSQELYMKGIDYSYYYEEIA